MLSSSPKAPFLGSDDRNPEWWSVLQCAMPHRDRYHLVGKYAAQLRVSVSSLFSYLTAYCNPKGSSVRAIASHFESHIIAVCVV